MRALAFLHALVKMLSAGHLYVCEPVWSWGPDDRVEPTVPSVACGKQEVPIDPRYADQGWTETLVWYEITCTPDGCWP